MRPISVVLVALILLVPAAHAADPIADAISELKKETKAPTKEDKIREASIDLSVPKSPAFTALGLTPESVVRPTSPRAFAAALLSGADPNGNIQTGVAVEIAPYLLYAGNNVTLRQYRENYGIRFASRTQFSFAIAKGANDEDEATRIALGLVVTPFDRGDSRNDQKLLDCFEERIGKVHKDAVKVQHKIAPLVASNSPEWPTKLEKEISQLEQQAKSEADTCRKEARKRNWNASAWSVGIAPTWTAAKGNVGDLDWSGVGIWTSVSYGFEEISNLEDNAQILLHARYRSDELAPDPMESGTFFEQDTLTIAGQIRVAGFSFRKTTGGPDLNFLFETAYVNENRKGRPDEELLRYTLGFDYRIMDDLYLDFSIGTEDGRDDGGDNSFGISFGMATLKWGFSDKPRRNVK